MKVLVVEDEKRLAEAIAELLKSQKYLVDVVHDGSSALDYADISNYDVMVLDLMIPIVDGFTVIREIRKKKNNLPILILTARESVKDKVDGLNCGADDYMTKPFSSDEFLARVNALSRRQGEVVIDEITVGDLTLDLVNYELKCKEEFVHLSFKEFAILKILMSYPKTVVTKENLIVDVWGFDTDTDDNNVEAYISFIRKKMSFLNSNVYIRTLRKVGYRLEVAE